MAKKKRLIPPYVLYPQFPKLQALPRIPAKPKGMRALQSIRRPAEVMGGPGPVPANMTATLPEWRVIWWLEKHDIPYDFQSSQLGGRSQLGGIVVDVILPAMVPPIAIQVQGLAFHYNGLRGDPQKDQRSRDILESMGYLVVFVDEDDANTRLDYVMSRAIRGEDISRYAWSR